MNEKPISKFEGWINNMMLTAFLNPKPDAIIKQQAELVSKSWGKSIPKADRTMLKLIIAAKQDRGQFCALPMPELLSIFHYTHENMASA